MSENQFPKANRIRFGKKCEFYHSAQAAFLAIWPQCLVKDLNEKANANCCDEIKIYFRTDKARFHKDCATYSKRLAEMTDWNCTEWKWSVINGVESVTQVECIATRKPVKMTIREAILKYPNPVVTITPSLAYCFQTDRFWHISTSPISAETGHIRVWPVRYMDGKWCDDQYMFKIVELDRECLVVGNRHRGI